MSTNEAENRPNLEPVPSAMPPAPPSASPTGRPPWIPALAAALVATCLSWAAGEAAFDRFNPGTLADPMAGPFAGGVSREAVNEGLIKDAMLTYGIQAAVLGLMLGLAGAVAGGTRRSAILGAGAGLIIGAAVGTLGSLGIFGLALNASDPDSRSGDLLGPLLAHAGVWGLVGGAGGLAFGLGMGGGRSRVAAAAIGGLACAAIGAVAYELGAAILFADSKSDQPVPDARGARLMAHTLTNLFAALGAALAVSDSRKPKVR